MASRKGIGAPVPRARDQAEEGRAPERAAAVATAVPTAGPEKLFIQVGEASWPLVGARLLVGRAGGGVGADIELDDESVSRRHAELVATQDGWSLRDLGSTNGTTVGGATLAAGSVMSLGAGAIVRFGSVDVRLTVSGASQQSG